MHYVPTSCSWLNLIERWFAELTNKRIRRDSFLSVDDLIAAIEEFLAAWNENPKPFSFDGHRRFYPRQARPVSSNLGANSARLYRSQNPQTKVQLILGHYTRMS